MFLISYAFKGQVHDCVCRKSVNCKSLVLQDKCNIEIFLSPAWGHVFPRIKFIQAVLLDQNNNHFVPNYFLISQIAFDTIFNVFPFINIGKLSRLYGDHVFQQIKFICAILVLGQLELFVPNCFKIDQVVFDKKISYIFALSIHRKNWPHPLAAMFSNGSYYFCNLGRWSPKDHLFFMLSL